MGGGGRFRTSQRAALLAAGLAFASLHQLPMGRATTAIDTAAADEALLLAEANVLRAAAGLSPLALDNGLSSFARRWSAVMAAAGDIRHNPDLASALGSLPPESTLRENVGMGPGAAVVHRALVASPSHRANLVNPRATRVGIGVVRVGAVVYVTQNFVEGVAPRRPASPQAASPAAPRGRATIAPPAVAATARLRLVLDQLRTLGV